MKQRLLLVFGPLCPQHLQCNAWPRSHRSSDCLHSWIQHLECMGTKSQISRNASTQGTEKLPFLCRTVFTAALHSCAYPWKKVNAHERRAAADTVLSTCCLVLLGKLLCCTIVHSLSDRYYRLQPQIPSCMFVLAACSPCIACRACMPACCPSWQLLSSRRAGRLTVRLLCCAVLWARSLTAGRWTSAATW